MALNAITIEKPGPYCTLQDAGRRGMRRWGIPWAGAMTPHWQQLANTLVGNDRDNTIIECFEGGLQFRTADEPVRIAVAADFTLSMHVATSARSVARSVARSAATNTDNRQKHDVKPWRSYTLPPHSLVQLNGTGNLRQAVIAIAGLQVSPHLGSTSTYIKAGLGGLDGAALRAGDELILSTGDFGRELECQPPMIEQTLSAELRVVLGPQDDHFSERGIDSFLTNTYVLSSEVDRMGARLTGQAIEHLHETSRDIVSDAIVPGSIQIPGNGQPIVLLNDSQTAGGYPKIATLLSVDLPKLSLQRPGAEFHFRALSITEAIDVVRDQHATLQKILNSVKPVTDNAVDIDALYTHNLIDGVTDGSNMT